MAKVKHPVTAYADQVITGKVPAGELVTLACERHIRDLKTAKTRGLRFSEPAADHAIEFYRFLRHSKGEWAGCELQLEPWQVFIIGSVFGWLRSDGTRRYRTAYNEVPRKNGKSTLAAGVGLYLFMADGEPGPEIYSAATKRDQARIVWNESAQMVKASPFLSSRVKVYPGKGNMNILLNRAIFEPLGADADTMDGLNIHGAIVDELHAHKNRGVWDILETATGARRQPLIFAITTAGYDRNSICWEQREYAERVLRGVIEDDTYFAYIACIDEGDDWLDESTWAKANPNLGVSVKIDDLRRKAQKAREMPAAQNGFMRLHLNRWTTQNERWMSMEAWDASSGLVVPEKLVGRECYAGLDLSSTTDLTSLVLVFPDYDNGSYTVLPHYWLPRDTMLDKEKKDKVPYSSWVRQGFMTATDGSVIDYGSITQKLLEWRGLYDIKELAFDRWGASKLVQELDDLRLCTLVPFGQGFMSMSPPTKELMNLVLQRRLVHGGNPVLRWNVDSLVVQQDPAGNLKPNKAKSTARIDGAVAMIMALDRAIKHQVIRPAYEGRELRTL